MSSGAPRRKLTGPLRLFVAIRDADLGSRSSSLRSLLQTLATYCNFDDHTAYPSAEKLARGSGLSVSSVYDQLKRAKALGVVHDVGKVRYFGHVLTRWRLDVNTLESLAPAGSTPPNGATESGNSVGIPAGGDKQTFHPSDQMKQTNHPSNQKEQIGIPFVRASALMDGCGDETPDSSEARRELLSRFQVVGYNLDTLALAPGITLAIIKEEWRSVCADSHVRNRSGLLVKRLKRRAGLTLENRRPLSREEQDLQAHVERIRRSSQHSSPVALSAIISPQ